MNDDTPKTNSNDANAKMTERTLGRAAFETYSATIGGRTYDGKQIPPWTALPDQIKAAWEAAARAVEARVGTALPKSGESAS